MDDVHANKAVMLRIYEEVVNGRDLQLMDDLFAVDMIEHEDFGGGNGRDGLRAFFVDLFAAFPDYQMSVDDLIAEGDKVVARVRSSATHSGPFLGNAPTGRRFEVAGIDIMRFEAEQVVEHWGVTDVFGMTSQLGLAVPVDTGSSG